MIILLICHLATRSGSMAEIARVPGVALHETPDGLQNGVAVKPGNSNQNSSIYMCL